MGRQTKSRRNEETKTRNGRECLPFDSNKTLFACEAESDENGIKKGVDGQRRSVGSRSMGVSV